MTACVMGLLYESCYSDFNIFDHWNPYTTTMMEKVCELQDGLC